MPRYGLVLILLFPWAISAQPAAKPRPKIGVAFEGGGALGLAHIGALQWLEEHRIPIDFIAGTSMGGLVGGLYATGMPPQELRDLVSKIDWGQTIGGQIPFADRSYRRKEDQRAFQNSLEFGLRDGFSLPSGLTAGQNITFLLDRETLPYSRLENFDQLPIPFRCVATDLASGRSFVFKDGPLGDALRATMSLPAVFDPVRRNNSIYADGGLLDNLPVDVVKGMGADIVIAISLNPTPFRPESRLSLFSVLDRSISVMIAANEARSVEAADLVISVDLSGYTSNDYNSAEKIIPRGYEAAARKTALLDRLSLEEPDWQRYQTAREARRIRSTPAPEFVSVTGVRQREASEIEKTVAEQNVGKAVNSARIEQDINIISGKGRFAGFSYGMTDLDGRPGLALRGTEKSYAPPFLDLGFLIDGSDLNNVRWTANGRITAMDVGSSRSELRTNFSLGATWGLGSDYYKLLGATSKWFVDPSISATNSPFDLYNRTTPLASYRVRQVAGQLDLGYAIDRFSEVRFGYDIGYLRTSLSIGSPVLPTPAGREGISSVRYALDRLDSPLVPRSGVLLEARAQWDDAYPGAPHGFPLTEASLGVIRRVSKPGSVYVQGFAGTTFGHDDTGIPQFFLGGPGRLSAYGTNELRTDQYWLTRLGYVHELFSLPTLLGNKVYATAAYEIANAYGAPNASRLPNDGSIGIVMETFLGPLVIGGSVGDSGHHKVYFLLGRFF